MIKFMTALLLLVSFNSFAADSSSGCGFGWTIAPKQSLVSSWTRAMVNATASNSIGMTMGTSGCAKHSIVINEKRGIHFVESNFHQMIVDTAKGNGQYLEAFGEIVDFKGNKKLFAKIMQNNFKKLYPSQQTTPSEFYSNFKAIITNSSHS